MRLTNIILYNNIQVTKVYKKNGIIITGHTRARILLLLRFVIGRAAHHDDDRVINLRRRARV